VSAARRAAGLHFAQLPPSQSQIRDLPVRLGVRCVVDIRVRLADLRPLGLVVLDNRSGKSVYLSEVWRMDSLRCKKFDGDVSLLSGSTAPNVSTPSPPPTRRGDRLAARARAADLRPDAAVTHFGRGARAGLLPSWEKPAFA